MVVTYHTDGYPDGHTYVDPRGGAELVRKNQHQPGHTVYRYSVRNEDLSDATQLRGVIEVNDELRFENDALKTELDDLKTQLSTCVYRLEYAQAMGWSDRAAEAIGQIGELV